MRLLYLSNAAIPSRATNAIQTMKMCAAFAETGCDVELLHAPEPWAAPEGLKDDVWAFYGVPPTFVRRRLRLPLPGLASRSRSYARAARATVLGAAVAKRARPRALPFACYARSVIGARLALDARRAGLGRSACRAVALEMHNEPPGDRGWDVAARADALFPITEALRERVVERIPQVADRIWVEHDGTDLGPYNNGDRAAVRRRLGLSVDEPLVVYTGRGLAGKGVDVLLEAARGLQDVARVVVVGKIYEPNYESVAAELPNVTLTGFVAPAAVPDYQMAADVLVMPTTADLHYSAYTSPLKLFEYMAAGNPIVASDLPTLREVLADGRNALLYPGRDPEALADAVRRLLTDRSTAAMLAANARSAVAYYRWSARAARIVGRLSALMHSPPIPQTPPR